MFVLVDISLVLLKAPFERISFSLSNIYAQIINDVTGETLVLPAPLKKITKKPYGGNM
jgi:ribosomal protein L18